MPQPNLVPVMPSTSRSTQRRGVSPSTSTLCVLPLTLMLNAMRVFPSAASARDQPGSDQFDRNIDVAACGFRVRTNLVRFVDQGLGGVAIDTRQADVQTSTEKVATVRHVQIHFGVDRDVSR